MPAAGRLKGRGLTGTYRNYITYIATGTCHAARRLLQQSCGYATRAVQRGPRFPGLARLRNILLTSHEEGCHQETYVVAPVFTAFHRENTSSTNARNSDRSVSSTGSSSPHAPAIEALKPLHLRAGSAPFGRARSRRKLRPVMKNARSYDKTVQANFRREPKLDADFPGRDRIRRA
jgi:hypothetical protein